MYFRLNFNRQLALDRVSNSTSEIRVLTPTIPSEKNKYLPSLWASVQSFGVEVSEIDLSALVEQQLKTSQKLADVIHLHWVQGCYRFSPQRKVASLQFTLKNLCYLLFLKWRGYQLVWTVHNTLSHGSSAPWLEYSFRWLLSRLCSDIIVMSEYGRQEFAQLYGRTKRVHLIPHGNYIGAYPNRICRTIARQQLGIAPNQTVLLYFGKIQPYKGLNHLIATFSQLKDPDVVLIIAGLCREPELRAEFQQASQLDPRIRLHLEFIPDEEIQVYMNACDWVILPFQNILNSGSVLLALSYGRPVLVPHRGALTELIADGQHGFCYSHDGELAATLMQAVATPPVRWQQMCAGAYALAQQHDWSKIGAQLYQIYQQDV